MSIQLYAPNGSQIIGTDELTPGCAWVSEWDRLDDGTLEPMYEGETEMYWDGQETQTAEDGSIMCIAQDGEVWPLSACEVREIDE